MAEKLVLSLIKRECITITENSTISDLTNLLTLNDIGAVVVVNSNNKHMTMFHNARTLLRLLSK